MYELRESMMEKKSRLQQEYKRLVQAQGLSNTDRPSQDVSLEFLEVFPFSLSFSLSLTHSLVE
jgi:hypothetical protein